ncbi:HAMP domain-containing sensor histidine kinase [Petroclostridium sp. X23]|uniref:HAMP domain-containing sensor histidine kinase n=1 Tax=Petroclostridium sp. X23 TaxID=3045146 RepID=UPI0024AD8483|nr:HAMP domain-containing sensor histidine kinase [Petroclostridium sp. X23]WHH58743.1 HAMP domain-containing sensor histidine kinase [Petroclostridium sp. X23]
MKGNTIKWRIFKYNLIVILLLIALTTAIFNIAVRLYIKNDILDQLNIISSRTEDIALRKGPEFFPKPGESKHKLPPPPDIEHDESNNDEVFRFYFMLDRSLREPLSVLNADYILLDGDKNIINISLEEYFNTPDELLNKTTDEMFNKIADELHKSDDLSKDGYLSFHLSGIEYISIVKPVSEKNSFGLGWIVIYSSLEKLNQLQWTINYILFAILILSAIITVIFSSLAAKKICAPFSSLDEHIGAIAERNFGTKLNTPVYEELQEFVNNINMMSEKLEIYDKAQKTFLQNASHEFRTPLMTIQSYAEGIKYNVVDSNTAANIVLDETKRMTLMVEDLLYLSRLDTIEENYHYENLKFNELIDNCIERMNRIAIKNSITIINNKINDDIKIYGDEEKLCRAITNLIGNCIRYANCTVLVNVKAIHHEIKLTISDDGPGFESDELHNVFERFYKGKKGNFGLGLAISKNIIEKHNGIIMAKNTEAGALFIIELPTI